MTDLTTGKEPRTTGQLKENLALTLASGQKVSQGLAAGILLATGKVVSATGGQAGTVLYIGTFFADYDASSSGANADIPCLVKLHRPFSGVWMSNKTGDLVVTADIGHQVYLADNHTACHTAASNIVAGTCWGFDSVGRVLIEPLAQVATQAVLTKTLDLTSAAFAANAWSPSGASLVSGTTYVVNSASGLTANATLNLPTSGVATGAEVTIASDGTQGAYTMTFKIGGTTQFTALAASIHWSVTAVNLGNSTTSNWSYKFSSASV